ncbi:hypothetical protein CLV59_110206 [Chitinophaga dinghuensis]|uniref:Uncharacterized protein n=1 Tax=Chitinophaga dinghuensis TaxID=1539050 RepID=A0A327VP21_9BACT|nr:hypothetical protein [Chitinophaga dinghuensis]RAJ75157.1 hypothetical protein CLV59_110206 [Chitinophaga dinghuensis]
MTFRLRLYRILTGIGLLLGSFLTIRAFLMVLMTGFSLGALTSLFFMSIFFVHSLLSLYLQRSLLLPQIPLKENTPGGIRILGGIILVITALWILGGVTLVTMNQQMVDMLRDMVKTTQPDAVPYLTPNVFRTAGVLVLLLAGVYFVNVLLSFSFLRKWKEEQQKRENEQHPDDDNLML